MDDDARTLWCGNLSDKVTEDILYELFLQGGPIQKLCIPKDRDGKQRTYGFITYKYTNSVSYALNLFDGTMLYNRPLSMKPRNNVEKQQSERPLVPCHNINYLLQQQFITGNLTPQINLNMFGANIMHNIASYSSQAAINSCNNDRNFRRTYPYYRDRDRDRNRDKDRDRDKDRERNRERNHHRDERLHSSKDTHHSHDYSRYNDNRKRWKPYP